MLTAAVARRGDRHVAARTPGEQNHVVEQIAGSYSPGAGATWSLGVLLALPAPERCLNNRRCLASRERPMRCARKPTEPVASPRAPTLFAIDTAWAISIRSRSRSPFQFSRASGAFAETP